MHKKTAAWPQINEIADSKRNKHLLYDFQGGVHSSCNMRANITHMSAKQPSSVQIGPSSAVVRDMVPVVGECRLRTI